MTPEYIPLKHFSDCIIAGWKMVMPLHPGDYAVLMVPPSDATNNREAGADRRLSAFIRKLNGGGK